MDNVNHEVPSIPNQPPIKTSNNLSFAKALAYGLVIVSVGVFIAVGGYVLGTKKSQPPFKSQTECESNTGKKCSLEMCQVSVGSPQPLGCKTGFYPYENPSPTTTAQPTSTESAETANWKTYNSVKGSFSIKYPSNWPLVNEPLPNDPSALLDDIAFSPNYKTNSGDTIIVFITAGKQGGFPTLNEYLNYLKQDSSIIGIKETIIGGEKAVSYRRSGGMGILPIIEYAVFKNGIMYSLALQDSLETNKNRETNIAAFDQILSTFKFTQ